jgi:hypothetical protein
MIPRSAWSEGSRPAARTWRSKYRWAENHPRPKVNSRAIAALEVRCHTENPLRWRSNFAFDYNARKFEYRYTVFS